MVLVDLVEGEMSTRGTVETRRREALDASRIIGATARENLHLADANISNTPSSRRAVVEVVRRYQPAMVLVPYHHDRHPDHEHAAGVIYDGVFSAGLERLETGQEPWRPGRLAYYLLWDDCEPDFVVDISDEYEQKTRAIMAYRSQFTAEDPGYTRTRLTSDEFAWRRESRMRYYGSLIGARYGEPFIVRGVMQMGSPLDAQFHTF